MAQAVACEVIKEADHTNKVVKSVKKVEKKKPVPKVTVEPSPDHDVPDPELVSQPTAPDRSPNYQLPTGVPLQDDANEAEEVEEARRSRRNRREGRKTKEKMPKNY